MTRSKRPRAGGGAPPAAPPAAGPKSVQSHASARTSVFPRKTELEAVLHELGNFTIFLEMRLRKSLLEVIIREFSDI